MKTRITVEKVKNGFIISNATTSVKIVATTEKAAKRKEHPYFLTSLSIIPAIHGRQ